MRCSARTRVIPARRWASRAPAFQLWDAHLRFDPDDPAWPLRDRFILSNGHASMLLYALLHLYEYALTLDDIASFRQLHSKTPGHPEHGHTPGVEVTTGPLGQGFAHGVGMALAARATRARFAGAGDGPGNHFVYGVVSDGDLMEGISAEAGSLAGHWRLGNLIYLYDDNQITIDGPTSLCFSEDVRQEIRGAALARAGDRRRGRRGARFRARCRSRGDRPPFADHHAHGDRPRQRRGRAVEGARLAARPRQRARGEAARAAGPSASSTCPTTCARTSRARAAAKRAARRERDAQLASWRRAQPAAAAAWDAARARRVPDDLDAQLAEGREGVADATRNHGAVMLERLADAMPYLIGGSADLAGSNAPPILKGRGTIGDTSGGADFYAGTNIHFGVREHAMAAITNGIALDGTLRPYCGTFLIFSDYLRPSLRLAALMGIPSLFVFTHDSIYLGEDGPTHQPIEQLDALRAIPNVHVFRPADGLETAAAYAMDRAPHDGPVAARALAPEAARAARARARSRAEDVARGAYAVRDPANPQVVLVASGSEVSLACDAAEKLHAENVAGARRVAAVSRAVPRAAGERGATR